MKSTVTRLLAIIITLTAILMTSVAAINRGGTFIEQILLVSISIIMVLAVHFLPSISRRAFAWMLWTGCFICAIFGHLTFLTHSTMQAGENRAQQSFMMKSIEMQIDSTRSALNAISARPVAVVSSELAQTDGWRQTIALREELKQAKRADALRDELIRLSAVNADTLVTASADPVMGRVATVTGFSQAAITLGVGLLFSILLELTGAFLWSEVLRSKIELVNEATSVTQNITNSVTHAVTHSVTARVTQPLDSIAHLRKAISENRCRPTVAGIRTFLNCSQQRAMALRKEILEN